MRKPWDLYYLDLAEKASEQSTCIRRRVGAVAVNVDNRLIGTAFNGAPSGMFHCTSNTCIRTKENIPSGTQLDRCKALHAEANLVITLGISQLKGSKIYCTTRPCTSCIKLLLGAKVDSVIWEQDYPDDYSQTLMEEIGTVVTTRVFDEITKVNRTITKYTNLRKS